MSGAKEQHRTGAAGAQRQATGKDTMPRATTRTAGRESVRLHLGVRKHLVTKYSSHLQARCDGTRPTPHSNRWPAGYYPAVCCYFRPPSDSQIVLRDPAGSTVTRQRTHANKRQAGQRVLGHCTAKGTRKKTVQANAYAAAAKWQQQRKTSTRRQNGAERHHSQTHAGDKSRGGKKG